MNISVEQAKVKGTIVTWLLAFGFVASSSFAVGVFVNSTSQASINISGLQTQVDSINTQGTLRWDMTNKNYAELSNKISAIDAKVDFLIRLSKR